MKNIFLLVLFLIGKIDLHANAIEYFVSDASERLIEEETDIRLLTWNILGLPNDQVAVRPWEERIDGIAEKILSIDADVVILQECFEKDLSLGLRDRLKEVYAHSYLHLEEKSTPLPSGMALFSKLPVSSFRFTPHPDLLDSERNSKMGTIDFVLLNARHCPIAHIAASHFQGSSNCEWRVGLTEQGTRLSYAEVREQEANAAFSLSKIDGIPHYVCGDLNVDRRSTEYHFSLLNAERNLQLMDAMNSSMKQIGTNTNFWKHEKGLSKMYPELSQDQTLSLANRYRKLYEEKLKSRLSVGPWNLPLSAFDPSYFSTLEEELQLTSEEEKRIWEYFKTAAVKAIAKEIELWQGNQNQGSAPSVSIGRVIEIRALPIEESLDYVLGINPFAQVKEVVILKGYDDFSVSDTLSDHHPVLATIQIAQQEDLTEK